MRIIASLRTDWDDAAPLLNKAIDALRELNRAADPSDTYAIVTLAEGRISVILKFFGVALASNKLASSKGCLLLHDETFAEPRRKFSFERIFMSAIRENTRENHSAATFAPELCA